jgi:hypothetical protein
MSSGSSLTSKLYDKIIKMLSKSHETIPLSRTGSFKIVSLIKDFCAILQVSEPANQETAAAASGL